MTEDAGYPDRKLTTEDELRKLFSDANIEQRARQGKLERRVIHRGEFDIKLDNEDDLVRTVVTGGDGFYNVPLLNPGPYRVGATLFDAVF